LIRSDFEHNAAERDFSAYIDNALRPIVDGTGSNGERAAFLNRQLDEWELEAERPEGEPIAPLVIDALEQIRLELTGCGLGCVLWTSVESNGCAWGSLVDGVDHQFKQSEALRREP
jgi:hypothetical protein